MKRFRLKAEAAALAFAMPVAACHHHPAATTPSGVTGQNRPPSVRIRCEPCSVQMGKSVTVGAAAQDPDGDRITYVWTAPSGALANPASAETLWTAPLLEGPVPVTISVNDGKGGFATDAITIQVTKG
jgi:Big-like domain-containing protein